MSISEATLNRWSTKIKTVKSALREKIIILNTFEIEFLERAEDQLVNKAYLSMSDSKLLNTIYEKIK